MPVYTDKLCQPFETNMLKEKGETSKKKKNKKPDGYTKAYTV